MSANVTTVYISVQIYLILDKEVQPYLTTRHHA
jgi:hypothetical protein